MSHDVRRSVRPVTQYSLAFLMGRLLLGAAIFLACAGVYLQSVRKAIAATRAIQAAGGTAYCSYQTTGDQLNAAAKARRIAIGSWKAPIASLYSVTYVELRGQKSGDAEIELLTGTPWVTWLNLRNSSVTAQGLRRLSQILPGLERLELVGVHLDDDAVKQLARFQKLEWLLIDGTSLAADKLDRLRAALPLCRIDSGPLPLIED